MSRSRTNGYSGFGDVSRGDVFERPTSDALVDLHVYVVPPDIWRERYNNLLNAAVTETVSAGIIRVHPEQYINVLREEIAQQIGLELIPRDYVFLKSVGRSITKIKHKQEGQIKVKHFLPPHSYAPELFLLENIDSVDSSRSSLRPDSPIEYNDLSARHHSQSKHSHYQRSPYNRYSPLPQIPHEQNSSRYNGRESPDYRGSQDPGHRTHRRDHSPQHSKRDSSPHMQEDPYHREQSPPSHDRASHERQDPGDPREHGGLGHDNARNGDPRGHSGGGQHNAKHGHNAGDQTRRAENGYHTPKEQQNDGNKPRDFSRGTYPVASDRDSDEQNKGRYEQVGDNQDFDRQLTWGSEGRGQGSNSQTHDKKAPPAHVPEAHESGKAPPPLTERGKHVAAGNKHDPRTETYTNHTNEDSGIAGLTPDNHYRDSYNDDILDRRKHEEEEKRKREQELQARLSTENEESRRKREEEERKRREEEERRKREEEEERRQADKDREEWEKRQREEDERRKREREEAERRRREEENQQAEDERRAEEERKNGRLSGSDEELNQFPSPPALNLSAQQQGDKDQATVGGSTTTRNAGSKSEREQLLRELEQAREMRKNQEKQREELVKKAKMLQNKMQNRRNHARDLWKKRYFEEKKRTSPLEEQCNRLRHELEIIHRKLMNTLEGPTKDKATKIGDLKPSVQVGVANGEPFIRRKIPVAGYLHTVTENPHVPDFMTYDGRELRAHFQQSVPVHVVDTPNMTPTNISPINRSRSFVPMYMTPPPSTFPQKTRVLPTPPPYPKPTPLTIKDKRPFMYATAKAAIIAQNINPISNQQEKSSSNSVVFSNISQFSDSQNTSVFGSIQNTPLSSAKKLSGRGNMVSNRIYRPSNFYYR